MIIYVHKHIMTVILRRKDWKTVYLRLYLKEMFKHYFKVDHK